MLSITFQVDLSLPQTEIVGPITNAKSQGTLQYDDSVALANNRPLTRSLWLETVDGLPPSVIDGNLSLKHGNQFTVTGTQALYIKNKYAIGYASSDMAVLRIITETIG
jgi:hypothetical protein